MPAGRNAPCSCGSGQKSKRCCGAQSRDRTACVRREERVGREAEQWAFEQFADELAAAGSALLGTLAGAHDATWIAEHWVMLDHQLQSGGTAAQRYAALPDLPAVDRAIARRIASSRVGVHRVLACHPGERIELEDLLSGVRTRVASPSVSRQASAGALLLARAMPGEPPSLWGPARVIPRDHAHAFLVEVSNLIGAERDGDLRLAWPGLMTFRPPASPPVFAHAAWDIDDPEVAFDLLPETFEYDGDEDGAQVFLWRIGGDPDDYGGFLELYRDAIVFYTYANDLLDDAITLLSRGLGPAARLTEREVRPIDWSHAGNERRAA